jgi:hypothetical protein
VWNARVLLRELKERAYTGGSVWFALNILLGLMHMAGVFGAFFLAPLIPSSPSGFT